MSLPASPPSAAEVTLLTFSLGHLRLALMADTVLEVVRAVAITPLPGAPEVVEGVVDYRGVLVGVVDPRDRFGLPAAPLAPDQHFLVARAGSRLVALRVDRALDVARVEAGAIRSAEEAAPEAGYVAGVVRLADGLFVIHDLARFLDAREGRLLDEAIRARGEP